MDEGRTSPEREQQFSLDKGFETFFLRNFPDSCPEVELRRRIEVVGRVVDLYIPAKRDKFGNKFGFVRFDSRVGLDRKLEGLNNIWIGLHKIRAFILRFERPLETKDGMRGKGSGSSGTIKNGELATAKCCRKYY